MPAGAAFVYDECRTVVYMNQQESTWRSVTAEADRAENDSAMLRHLRSNPELRKKWDVCIRAAADTFRSSHGQPPGISRRELLELVPDLAQHGGVNAAWRLYDREVRAFHCPFGLGRSAEVNLRELLEALLSSSVVPTDRLLQVALLLGAAPHNVAAMKRGRTHGRDCKFRCSFVLAGPEKKTSFWPLVDLTLCTTLIFGYSVNLARGGVICDSGGGLGELLEMIRDLAQNWIVSYSEVPQFFDISFWGGLASSGEEARRAWEDTYVFGTAQPLQKARWNNALRFAAIHLCYDEAITAHQGSMRAFQRAIMLSAVLGSMDKHGMRMMLAHAPFLANLPWAKFSSANVWSVCEAGLVDPLRPELGRQTEDAGPRTFSIRVARWLQDPTVQKSSTAVPLRWDVHPASHCREF